MAPAHARRLLIAFGWVLTVRRRRDQGWHLYLSGPWFIAGGLAWPGLAFAAAATHYVRRHECRREVRLYGFVGALGALFLSLASVATGIG
ncbi:hypothetical protein [Streptomyces bambusae]|uniref:hypothetical protein n=1 Tax=Streptomyces bambusae TaxID=1550616 RepID=UPI001CA4A01D|nr:hypothetical protein [Streptomyces bambusae]